MKCRASGTLIIPEWKSAYFWPVIRPQPNKFADFVIDFRYPSKIPNLIIPGPGQLKIYKSRKSVFHGCSSFNMLALRIRF